MVTVMLVGLHIYNGFRYNLFERYIVSARNHVLRVHIGIALFVLFLPFVCVCVCVCVCVYKDFTCKVIQMRFTTYIYIYVI